ncbi:MAG: RNA-binding protein [Candidatus Thermoplasmatota archaeon]|nr:RNA-binding protein [Candidatus Thermoplasmatota archaeon]
MKLRKKHRLRKKDVEKLSKILNDTFGKEIFTGNEIMDQADAEGNTVLSINNEVLGLIINDKPFLTLKGLLKYKPEKKYVTVDKGAVKFVCNGADIMAPGVVDADSSVKKNDLVWVRDEKYKKALAVGIALMDAEEMVKGKKGKAVLSIHYIGDKIWKM